MQRSISTGYTTDANGYFVLGNPGVPNAGLTFDPGQFGLLQNGPDAVALYVGHASDFPNGTVVTTNNLLDAVVYGTDDPAPANLMPLINAGQKIVNENATGNSQTQSSQRCPAGMGGFRNTSPYYPGAPTPGTANNCPATRPPSDVVISQIYGGGGNSGATYQNDFVELYNRGAGTGRSERLVVAVPPAASNGSAIPGAADRRQHRRRQVLPDPARLRRCRSARRCRWTPTSSATSTWRRAAEKSRLSTASTRSSADARSTTRTSWISSATALPTAARD